MRSFIMLGTIFLIINHAGYPGILQNFRTNRTGGMRAIKRRPVGAYPMNSRLDYRIYLSMDGSAAFHAYAMLRFRAAGLSAVGFPGRCAVVSSCYDLIIPNQDGTDFAV